MFGARIDVNSNFGTHKNVFSTQIFKKYPGTEAEGGGGGGGPPTPSPLVSNTLHLTTLQQNPPPPPPPRPTKSYTIGLWS